MVDSIVAVDVVEAVMVQIESFLRFQKLLTMRRRKEGCCDVDLNYLSHDIYKAYECSSDRNRFLV